MKSSKISARSSSLAGNSYLRRPLPLAAVRNSKGQATTELVVVAFVLAPLFLIVPLVGKYLDLMQTAEAASRYVAFEGAVKNSSNAWKQDTQLAQEVRRRFFSNSDAPIKTNDVAGDIPAHRNPLWADHRNAPLLEKFSTSVNVQSSRSNRATFGQIAGISLPADFSLDRYINSGFKLPYNNLNRGRVTVTPSNVPNFKPFDKINLSISRQTVVLTDTWGARSADDVQGKITNAGIYVYPLANDDLTTVYTFVGFLPPLLTDQIVVPGLPRWDVVPSDRIR